MYPCADGATPLPGICGWRHILRTANFIDVAQEAIETGLSSTLPHAVRHHRLPPNYFLLGSRATPSIPTSKRSSSRFLERNKMRGRRRRASGASRGLHPAASVQGPPPEASRGLQAPGASRGLRRLQPFRGLRTLKKNLSFIWPTQLTRCTGRVCLTSTLHRLLIPQAHQGG